ncbi:MULTISPECIES: oligosaccharide flippase family protein [Streptomyces]|uniref:Lipopolysaccharide biosynthesis protein n=1 Tax=Streptomyces spororaveus TaxID=284039 RepID=A0ABQ3T906_9ACTN|nr:MULTISPECIES: oligosaccharide flippase family protein [Streptomyces]MCM9082692.1 oligosaccharide flippase family protein [Streptomyces spororaveus]MCX5302540.1 oligosaccharide flippase family protein [Streptomyces sp. NBC_00160]GHI76884.1 lipopolysaccharide biosynthesis protein [Streptomyces spororaveus]
MTGPAADTESTAPAAAPSLGRKVGSAAKWSLINTVVMRLGNFATGIVLARFFLGPEAWGVYGIAQTVLLVLLSANELGVSLAIVRWEGDPRRFAPTVLTLSAASSCLLYAVLFAVAPAVAEVLGSPEASGVLRVMCLCVVLDGLSQVPAGFLTREFAQGRRMAVDGLNFVLSTAVTLVLAVQGWGAMSFAWGSVVGNVAALIGCCLAAPGTLRFGWDREQARALLKFGLPLAGASMLALGVVNVDTMVVGSALDPLALGFYVLAFNISGWPVRIISEAARRVSFAGFSRLADSPQALAAGFARALGVVMAGTVPICVLLAALAAPVVELVYGERWLPAARALPWLMALGLVRIGCELAYDCLVAIGRRSSLIAVQALWLVVLIPALVIGARTGGIVGVAQGHVLVAGAVVVPVFLLALHRGGILLGTVARACAWPLLGGAVMAGVLLLLERYLGDSVLALLATGAAGTLCYVLCVLPGRASLKG